MNELTKKENYEIAPGEEVTSFLNENEDKSVAEIRTPPSFIPELKVTYKTSDHFAKGKAKLGEFFLDNQALGTKINVVLLDYRFQSIARKVKEPGKGSFVDKIILKRDGNSFYENPLYKEFKKKNEAQCGQEFEDGADLLLFLPDFNLFGALFGKKKLADGAYEILQKGGNKRVLNISTMHQQNKDASRVWFTIDPVQATTTKLEKIEGEKERIEVFQKSIEEAATPEEVESTTRDR